MRGIAVRRFEKRLKRVFDQIDNELEDGWGERYALHPARHRRGETANPESDGLFNVGASFSVGLGSQHGRGYTVEIRMSTLAAIPEEDKDAIREHVASRATELLPRYFPDRELKVVLDGSNIRIVGDLSL